MPVTRIAYTVLVALVAAERLVELRIAERNRKSLLARGGVEVGAGHYPFMVALHTAFLVSCLAEVWLAERPFHPRLAGVMVAILLAAAGLRFWVIHSLGDRWTTRVICLPAEPLVTKGPYRWLRHPNYLAVVLEIIALPMVHTAWVTALVFGLANAALLRVRVGVEEEGLRRISLGGGAADARGTG